MKRFAVSGTYTAAGFLAALAVVVLVVQTTPLAEQAKFFYFQAIFYVLSTVMSQTLTLSTFRNTSLRSAGVIADVCAVLIVFGFLSLSSAMAFDLVEKLMLGGATVLLYRGAALLISVQFYSRNSWRFLWVPLLALLVRVGAAWLAVPFGMAAMFLASTVVAFALPFGVLHFAKLKERDTDPNRSPPGRAATAPIFVFFLIGALTFQWERLLYGLGNNTEALVITGYVMTAVLPPLSSLFATLYRGNAREIFEGQTPAMRQRRFVRIGGAFAAASLAYIAVLVVFWPQIMALLGAEIVPDVTLVLLLGGAVILDRLANLMVFLRQSDLLYTHASVAKGALIALGCIVATTLAAQLPLTNYVIFISVALGYIGAVLVKRAPDAN